MALVAWLLIGDVLFSAWKGRIEGKAIAVRDISTEGMGR
jgi:hypothetical protein